MQHNVFVGNLGKTPVLSGTGDRAVCHFTLIENEYAGRDAEGNARQRTTSIDFVAFRAKAEAIAKTAMKGDQIIVTYRIENNNYTKQGSTEKTYGFNFIAEEFKFGAPGPEKRAQWANRENQQSSQDDQNYQYQE
ncbi:single-stranded DNA-binding protein [Pseudomonas syringae]|uniref:single-stranded DNA-binding protein n=1 Tax=Pseudomonas syringae TaxID=317 RepID=UPI0004673864|nr:single-stranded DNA-binding protein [Pseudomonas syringae]QGG78940.1 single-stranded DNA-binding protein [Pseudomonas syringae USA011]